MKEVVFGYYGKSSEGLFHGCVYVSPSEFTKLHITHPAIKATINNGSYTVEYFDDESFDSQEVDYIMLSILAMNLPDGEHELEFGRVK